MVKAPAKETMQGCIGCPLQGYTLQRTQNNGLDPKTRGVWCIILGTLEVHVGLALQV